MKTNSSKRQTPCSKGRIFNSNLKPCFINKIARQCGFIGRSDGKITPISLIRSFMKMVSKDLYSYSKWACELSMELGVPVSKQAVEERMNSKTQEFLKTVFKEEFSVRIKQEIKEAFTQKFSNIYCEDSTHFNLPKELADYYPGNISRGEVKSVAKIHVLYNMTENHFSLLDIHSFRQNDQGLCCVSGQYLEKGDLIVRDLGFMSLSSLCIFNTKGINFLTRKNYQTKVYDKKAGTELNLLKILKRKGFFDDEVLVGRDKQRMRMVVLPVSAQQASLRRHKARTDRDKRYNHSKEYYALLGYTILLTNMEKSKCSSTEAIKLYGLRWRIEIIFKSWKSAFCLQKIIPAKCKNIHTINCIIYLMLIYILLFQKIYRQCSMYSTEISLIKLSFFFRQNIVAILNSDIKNIIPLAIQLSKYESRKDRESALQKQFKLLT